MKKIGVSLLALILLFGVFFVTGIKKVKADPGSITIESATLTLSQVDHSSGDIDGNGFANIGDHIIIWLTVSNTDGGCDDPAGTVAHADLLKYGGGSSASLICYTDNGGIHDVLATELVIANAGADGIDVPSNNIDSAVALTVSDADDSFSTMTNRLGDGVIDTLTTWVDTSAPVITAVTPSATLINDALVNDPGIFHITYAYTNLVTDGPDDMDQTVDPTVSFTPDIISSGTLTKFIGTPGTYQWLNQDNYRTGYNLADVNETQTLTADSITGGRDIHGNYQVAYNGSGEGIVVDTAAPYVVSMLGDGSSAYTIPAGTDVHLIFSEGLDLSSLLNVQNAITAGADISPTLYSWSESDDLTITGDPDSTITFASNVFADVTDLAGNTSHVILIDSQTPNEVWVDSNYSAGNSGEYIFGFDAFSTIQTGIDGVVEGGTVTVNNGGTYDEEIEISRMLTLQGNAGGGEPGPGNNAPIIHDTTCDGPTIAINSNDVTVEGFIFNNYCDYPTIRVGGNEVNILDNELANNYVGVGLSHNGSYATVMRNLIDSNEDGIVIGGSQNNTISDNEIYNNDGYGIYFKCGNEGSNCDSSGTVVSANEIYANGEAGILFDAGDQGSLITVGPNNNIYNNTDGIYVSGDAFNFVIHGNMIHNNVSGPSGIHVENDSTGLDVSKNWWGDASGPVVTTDDNPVFNEGGDGETITIINSVNVTFQSFCTVDDCSELSTASLTPDDLNTTLFSTGIISANGSDPTTTTEITFNSQVDITVTAGVTVSIPSGTTFTAGSAGDFTTLASANGVSTAGLSGFTVAGDAMSFGIPDLDLTVNPAITISITVGASYNGQTLKIYRKDAAGTWSNSGSTCLVAGGICSFTTTHLSSFAAGTTTSSSGGGGGGFTPVNDTTAPTNASIFIDAGAVSVTSTNVTLTLSANDNVAVTQMEVSNSSDFTNINWETYATSKAWTLTDGNGTKTVYVKFRDAAGNVSAVVSDTITLTGQATEQPIVVIAPNPNSNAIQFVVQPTAVLSDAEIARRVDLMKGTYDWQLINQSPYPATLAPGEETEVWIEVKNIGTATWFNNGDNVVRLGSGSSYGNAGQQRDYNSEFANENWYSANRPTNIMHSEVDPGWNTRFQFIIKAPMTPGVYKAYFTPVVDGLEWMKDIGLYWQITVQ